MQDEYDFTGAERGKFYREDTRLNIPVYLDDEVREFVARIAAERQLDAEQVVNDLLRADMELGRVMR